MADLTKKLALFFESECKTLNDVDVLLENTQKQEAWLEAVMLFRKGMLALQKNDLSGLDSIRAANSALKTIVTKVPAEKPEAAKALSALNESVEKATKDNVKESIVNIKLAFSPLYKSLKSEGFKEIINETTFYEEEMQEDGGDQLDEDTLEGETVAPAPVEAPAATTPAPAAETTPTPIEEPVAESKKESAYDRGFKEGQSYYKIGETHKEYLNKVIESTLYQHPYSFVERYKQGFAAGFSHAEQVDRDMNEEAYKELDESKTKK